jgi:hypothetical protein
MRSARAGALYAARVPENSARSHGGRPRGVPTGTSQWGATRNASDQERRSLARGGGSKRKRSDVWGEGEPRARAPQRLLNAGTFNMACMVPFIIGQGVSYTAPTQRRGPPGPPASGSSIGRAWTLKTGRHHRRRARGGGRRRTVVGLVLHCGRGREVEHALDRLPGLLSGPPRKKRGRGGRT